MKTTLLCCEAKLKKSDRCRHCAKVIMTEWDLLSITTSLVMISFILAMNDTGNGIPSHLNYL